MSTPTCGRLLLEAPCPQRHSRSAEPVARQREAGTAASLWRVVSNRGKMIMLFGLRREYV